jgi:hypothetical protein
MHVLSVIFLKVVILDPKTYLHVKYVDLDAGAERDVGAILIVPEIVI